MHWNVNQKVFKWFLEVEVAAYLTRTIGRVRLSVQKMTQFLKSLSFFIPNAQVSAIIASRAMLL